MKNNRELYIRDTGPNDVDLIMKWENDRNNWHVSGTKEAYTRKEIVGLIRELNSDCNEQTRQMICLNDGDMVIGAIDLFGIDQVNQQASVGILIGEKQHRQKGYAAASLKLAEDLAINRYGLQKLTCSVHHWNKASLALFQNSGYVKYREENDLIYLEKWLKK